MARWPVRFVFRGPRGLRLEVKYPDFRDLRAGWAQGLPGGQSWKVVGVEVKARNECWWVAGATAFSPKIVRDKDDRFLFLDVWKKTEGGAVLLRWDRTGRMTEHVFDCRPPSDGWLPGALDINQD